MLCSQLSARLMCSRMCEKTSFFFMIFVVKLANFVHKLKHLV